MVYYGRSAIAAPSASSGLDYASPVPYDKSPTILMPIFEVAYDHGKWRPFTLEESLAFYGEFETNSHSAQHTSIQGTQTRKYVLDFATMVQINTGNDRRRTLRLVWLNPPLSQPLDTGSAERPAGFWLETAMVPYRPNVPMIEGSVPIFEIVYADGMLWPIPQELSLEIYQETYAAHQRSYTTSIENKGAVHAYKFDVESMGWMNLDTDHEGQLRLVWVSPGALKPLLTGKILGAKKNKKKKKRKCGEGATDEGE